MLKTSAKVINQAKAQLPDPDTYVCNVIKIKLPAYGRAVLFKRRDQPTPGGGTVRKWFLEDVYAL